MVTPAARARSISRRIVHWRMTSAFRGTRKLYNQGSDRARDLRSSLLAAFVGGALNAVAGGGSFIGLPALIFAGVPAVSANATNTLALWPASLSSAWAYRREVSATRAWIVSLGGVSLAGGLIGGLLLRPDERRRVRPAAAVAAARRRRDVLVRRHVPANVRAAAPYRRSREAPYRRSPTARAPCRRSRPAPYRRSRRAPYSVRHPAPYSALPTVPHFRVWRLFRRRDGHHDAGRR